MTLRVPGSNWSRRTTRGMGSSGGATGSRVVTGQPPTQTQRPPTAGAPPCELQR